MLLQGCWLLFPPVIDTVEPDTSPDIDINKDNGNGDSNGNNKVIDILPPEIPAAIVPPQFGRFTLRYDSKSALNPITTLNRDNILLSSLIYESLFVLDGNLSAFPLLCENWSTEDSATYTFEIKPNIAMHDGSFMTADDVAYSLKQAMLKGRYVSRFKTIQSVSSDGELTVTVDLYSPNSRFIKLLDVPIIKSGSIDSRTPPGTGPYVFAGDEAMRLSPFARYRDYTEMPVTFIYLIECGDNELTELFDDGVISLLWDDPSDAFDIRINRLPEKHFYNTTTLQFIGFNARRGVMRDADVRRAVGCSIDRQFIVDEILTGQQAIPAPLALNTTFWLYDKEWERRSLDPLVEMALLLDRAFFADYDDDSFLEIWDGADGYEKFTADFIVNIENSYRTQAAHKIADTLRRIGFNTVVRELPWESYLKALQDGNFDMYYGEIMLGADFDLSPLLLPNSHLNYGRTGSSDHVPFIDDFLSARTDEDIRYAAKRLCDQITVSAPFVPVVYKQHAIYFPMGAISGAAPSQSTVFYNLKNWKIDLEMLN